MHIPDGPRSGSPGWRRARPFTWLLVCLLLLGGCAPAQTGDWAADAFDEERLRQLSGLVRVDGSSTVFPISEAMAEEFQLATRGQVRVTVGVSGTGGGFKRFCAGEIDVAGASRPIKQSEIEACRAQGIDFLELPVAFDGIVVMVHPSNDFVDTITVDELRTIWAPEAQGTVTRWSQVRQGWPDEPFRLYGPGTDSGTFEYFTEAIVGEAKASRGDFTASEDDNVLVQGIANDRLALGYLGFAYYHENSSRLKAVKVDDGAGNGVAPTEETISDGSYRPLSRPIFIYANASSAERLEVREFLRFYLDARNARALVPQVGYVPLPEQFYGLAWQRVEDGQTGTVFLGAGAQKELELEDIFEEPSP